jgi:hypothetical protein
MHHSENGRRKEHAGHSPHYFIFENRKYPDSRSSRSEWHEHGRLVHKALKIIAGFDADHAHFANGKGFSRADVRDGHWYAGIDEHSFAALHFAVSKGEALVQRYRRQLPPVVRDYFDVSKRNQKQILFQLGGCVSGNSKAITIQRQIINLSVDAENRAQNRR